jgi:hypothetical protein
MRPNRSQRDALPRRTGKRGKDLDMTRILLAFVPVLVLGILAVVVLPSPWAGVAAFGALIACPLCGMWALRHQDRDATAHATRAALGGWTTGSF